MSTLTLTVSGTVALTQGSDQLVGTGTAFTTELQAGDEVTAGNVVVTLASIEDDTNATLTAVASATVATTSYTAIRTIPDQPAQQPAVEVQAVPVDSYAAASEAFSEASKKHTKAKATVAEKKKLKADLQKQLDSIDTEISDAEDALAEALQERRTAASSVITIMQQFLDDTAPAPQ